MIASPVERLTRNTDMISINNSGKPAGWYGPGNVTRCLATFLLARGLLAPVKRLVDGTHKLAAGDFTTRVRPPVKMSWANWRKTSTSSPARWRKTSKCAAIYGRYFSPIAYTTSGTSR
ncbi:HAMP domain-containing protein [Escherichia coli]